MRQKQCERCLKVVEGEGGHTCTPTACWQELERQRDELLAALERFMDSHEECTDFDGFAAHIVSMDDYHEAQEAIARVKGGAA